MDDTTANNFLNEIKKRVIALYNTDIIVNEDGDYNSMDTKTLDKVISILDEFQNISNG